MRKAKKRIKQIFEMKKVPNPWKKSIGIAICTGVPMIFGLIFNQALWSSLGALGSFAFLYVTKETYYRRAKKIFGIVIGFTVIVFLGTLIAPYPLLAIALLGCIGAIVTFTFGVLRIPGPAAIFFVLIYLVSVSMPFDQGAAMERALIIFISGCFSWLVSMILAPFDFNGPETRTLKELYMVVAEFSSSIGTEQVSNKRYKVVNCMMEAHETLMSAYIPWKESVVFYKVSLFYEYANRLFLGFLRLSYQNQGIIPQEFTQIIQTIAKEINLKKTKRKSLVTNLKVEIDNVLKTISKEEQEKYKKLIEILYEIDKVMNLGSEELNNQRIGRKRSKKTRIKEALRKESIVLNRAIRYGVILAIASAVSYILPFYKPYWLSLTCASVMLGATIMSTMNRAIERCVGTFIGLGLAAFILSLKPEGYLFILFSMLLSATIEFLIVKNYAIATIFITANAILLAENKAPNLDPIVFINARFIHVIIGSFIALLGTYLMGRRSGTNRFETMLLKLMQSQVLVIESLAHKDRKINITSLVDKMEMHQTNLKLTYTTALGEIGGNREKMEELSSMVYSLEYISYLLEQIYQMKGYLDCSDEDVFILIRTYEAMIASIEQKEQYEPSKLPNLEGIQMICSEVNLLQDIISNQILNEVIC